VSSPDKAHYQDRRPKLLDLFCGAGGAAMGYHRAGFDVVGVDIVPQRHYPFEFHQADAMTFPLDGFDAIHASPPCQRFSAMSACRRGLASIYPDLVGPLRERLVATGTPYIIENVRGAPLINPTMLTGSMFGLPLKRDRMFETSFPLPLMLAAHHDRPVGRAGHWRPGALISVSGNCSPISLAREAMGIDWMNRNELSEAIPPAYAEWIGAQLLEALDG
jgi:DNA (cytosine-5)-methyltransferase 1